MMSRWRLPGALSEESGRATPKKVFQSTDKIENVLHHISWTTFTKSWTNPHYQSIPSPLCACPHQTKLKLNQVGHLQWFCSQRPLAREPHQRTVKGSDRPKSAQGTCSPRFPLCQADRWLWICPKRGLGRSTWDRLAGVCAWLKEEERARRKLLSQSLTSSPGRSWTCLLLLPPWELVRSLPTPAGKEREKPDWLNHSPLGRRSKRDHKPWCLLHFRNGIVDQSPLQSPSQFSSQPTAFSPSSWLSDRHNLLQTGARRPRPQVFNLQKAFSPWQSVAPGRGGRDHLGQHRRLVETTTCRETRHFQC